MITHLQKITTRAKVIRKAHPKKAWTDCIKAAAKELKGGKVSGIKKPRKAAAPAKKAHKAPAKKAAHRVSGIGAIGSDALKRISSAKTAATGLESYLKLHSREMSPADRVKARKAISVHKANVRNLKKLI